MQDIKQTEENPFDGYAMALFDQYKEQYSELCDKALKTGFGKPVDPIRLAVEQEKARILEIMKKETVKLYNENEYINTYDIITLINNKQ